MNIEFDKDIDGNDILTISDSVNGVVVLTLNEAKALTLEVLSYLKENNL